MQPSPIRVVLLAVLLLLAGCNGGGESTTVDSLSSPGDGSAVTTATETAAETTTAGSNDDDSSPGPRTSQGQRFVELAEGNGVPIRDAFARNGTFHVVYRVPSESSPAVSKRGFTVAQAYMTTVNETWSTNKTWNTSAMEATAVTGDRIPVSTYRMPSYWGRRVKTTELFSESNLATDLDEATVRYINGSVPYSIENTSLFDLNLRRAQNGTITSVVRRGDTAFVTLETPPSDRELLKKRIARITTVYGAFVDRGWDVSRVELEVRSPDGDIYGWYHIKEKWARKVYSKGISQRHFFVYDTYFPENDGLDGSP